MKTVFVCCVVLSWCIVRTLLVRCGTFTGDPWSSSKLKDGVLKQLDFPNAKTRHTDSCNGHVYIYIGFVHNVCVSDMSVLVFFVGWGNGGKVPVDLFGTVVVHCYRQERIETPSNVCHLRSALSDDDYRSTRSLHGNGLQTMAPAM
jgi:hypothetical protein